MQYEGFSTKAGPFCDRVRDYTGQLTNKHRYFKKDWWPKR